MMELVIINRDHKVYCGDCVKYSTVNVLRCWILRNIEGLENRANIKLSLTYCPVKEIIP